MGESSVGVVLVTYNRIEKLKNALAAYDGQSLKPSWMIVVDNASTDSTPEFLAQWKARSAQDCEHVVVRSPENLGGAGGFALGMETAAARASDWIWLADDDAYPERSAFELLQKRIDEGGLDDCVAMCSSVHCGGGVDTAHRRRMVRVGLNVREVPVPLSEYRAPFTVDALSFVGAVVKRSALERVGLPEAGYFIWYDDTEYSLRLKELGTIICLPNVEVQHDVADGSNGISWKDYYGIRNSLDMIRRHYPAPVFYFNWLRALGKALTTSREHGTAYRCLRLTALRDVLRGKLGAHPVYKQDWTLRPR